MTEHRHFTVPDAVDLIRANDSNGRISPNQTNFGRYYWPWDSSFTANGLAYVDSERAQLEMLNLMKTQQANGMIPLTVMRDDVKFADTEHALAAMLGYTLDENYMTSSSILSQPPV